MTPFTVLAVDPHQIFVLAADPEWTAVLEKDPTFAGNLATGTAVAGGHQIFVLSSSVFPAGRTLYQCVALQNGG